MVWEDEVYADPDSVNVTTLVDEIHCEDGRQQYEAVVGIYWLADLRPSRLEPFETEIVGLLGEMPDLVLGTSEGSGGSTTRSWATEAVGLFTQAYPHVVPELFDLAKNSDKQTREDARNALGCAVSRLSFPSVGNPDEDDTSSPLATRVHDHHSVITDWLHDGCQSTTQTAFILLAGIAPWYCEEASKAVPVAASHLDDSTTQSSAIGFLLSVAHCNEHRRGEIVEQLGETLRKTDCENPELLALTLDALIEIAEQHPESQSQIEKWQRDLTDHDHLAVRTYAENLDSVLENRS